MPAVDRRHFMEPPGLPRSGPTAIGSEAAEHSAVNHSTDVVAGGDSCVASRMLESVTDGLIQVETDFLQYTKSY
jgi:hypothetical protein